MNERRKALMQKVQTEKLKNAGVPPTPTDEVQLDSNIIYGKHFFIETQADEDGDVYALYRATDLLSVAELNMTEPIAPVHVFDIATDAVIAMGVLDRLVTKIEGEDTAVIELPGVLDMGKPDIADEVAQ